MPSDNPFKWRQFEPGLILLCVRWYLRYAVSYRDLEEMMREINESGSSPCHEKVRRFTRLIATHAAQPAATAPGKTASQRATLMAGFWPAVALTIGISRTPHTPDCHRDPRRRPLSRTQSARPERAPGHAPSGGRAPPSPPPGRAPCALARCWSLTSIPSTCFPPSAPPPVCCPLVAPLTEGRAWSVSCCVADLVAAGQTGRPWPTPSRSIHRPSENRLRLLSIKIHSPQEVR